jgi:hypothetical protein
MHPVAARWASQGPCMRSLSLRAVKDTSVACMWRVAPVAAATPPLLLLRRPLQAHHACSAAAGPSSTQVRNGALQRDCVLPGDTAAPAHRSNQSPCTPPAAVGAAGRHRRRGRPAIRGAAATPAPTPAAATATAAARLPATASDRAVGGPWGAPHDGRADGVGSGGRGQQSRARPAWDPFRVRCRAAAQARRPSGVRLQCAQQHLCRPLSPSVNAAPATTWAMTIRCFSPGTPRLTPPLVTATTRWRWPSLWARKASCGRLTCR